MTVDYLHVRGPTESNFHHCQLIFQQVRGTFFHSWQSCSIRDNNIKRKPRQIDRKQNRRSRSSIEEHYPRVATELAKIERHYITWENNKETIHQISGKMATSWVVILIVIAAGAVSTQFIFLKCHFYFRWLKFTWSATKEIYFLNAMQTVNNLTT